MARDGVPVGPEFAALVVRHVQGERFEVSAECRRLGESTSRFYKYAARFRAEGVNGFYPRSRRPVSSPKAVSVAVEEAVVRARKELAESGWDAGADSIRFWLEDHLEADQVPSELPSRATINRVLRRRGLAELVPQRRPRAATRRFEAEQPNARWQMDGFIVTLASGTRVVVLHILDDCSRLDLCLQVMRSENSAEIWAGFLTAAGRHGLPAEVLTDNGTAFSGRRRGWMSPLETNLAALGIRSTTCTPGHPQTCGKVERAHKTVRGWLRQQPPPETATRLQELLETYRAHYNQRRKQHLNGLSPAQRHALGPPASPHPGPLPPQTTITTAKVSASGCVGVLGHLVGLGRAHAGTTVTLIRQDRHIAAFTDHHLVGHIDLKPGPRYQRAKPGTLSTKS